jgi:trehalose/maltose transport system substrate-binding protein
MSTWKGLEVFTEYFMQAMPAHSGVLVIDSVWLPSVADRLADLTEEFATHAESLLPEVVDACRVDGRLLALPTDVNLGVLYYRNDLLRKYGYSAPPATWEELERMAAVIQEGERAAGRRDFWGFIWPGHKPESLTCTALEWQHSEGGGCIIERNGRISIANEHAAAALARAARWVGTISPPAFADMSEWETQRAWVNGSAAFMRFWAVSSADRDPGTPNSSVKITILPRGSACHAATYGGWPLAVHSSFEQRNEAIDLVRKVSSPEVQRLLANQINLRLPVSAALYHDPALLQVHPFLNDVYKLITSGGLAVRPYHVAGKLYAQVSALYAETVAAILHSREEALPALTNLERSLAELGGWSC